ncbi:lipopolysaccharide biosynthesis protein [Maribacter algarum]|uniref:Lipopolysaccharide biosynthesis protein n=1 Tax=Maribacter algarum (ex Zhang et al. 2020) TaxID=2578118 RepID=A0A5S3PHR7_9FLAO|nr:lipopolysaccharide biosynthesis protein [Maribacter algarum]TMM53787.1 lipopolysaccharide biosynthesis protein [Maribacter algarum]
MSLGNKIFGGMVWSAVERISIQGVQFVLGIILARILTPEEYGIIGILIVFIVVSQVFIDSGFTKALIQKQDRTKEDISTVFWFNILISTLAYTILFFFAPLIADLYDIPLLSDLLRVLAISLIINALFTVPSTLYTIELDFKTLTKINFAATIISGGIAIAMAYSGYGVWSLVAQTLVRSIATALLIWIQSKWKPSFIFSKKSFKELFSFGYRLLVSSLLSKIVNNFAALFIAKYNTADLGYYTRGTQFSDVLFSTFNSVLERILLPGLAKVQDQKEVLIKHTKSILMASSLLIFPLFFFLAAIAEPLIRVLLTEKWMMAVPIMQIFCIARLITIPCGINVNLLYVIGRTDLELKQQYLKIIVRVILLLLALKHGIIYIALAELAATTIHFFINSYYPGKIMQYGAFSQIKDMSPIILSSLIMVVPVYAIVHFISNDILVLCITPFVALVIYLGLIRLFKVQVFDELIDRVKGFFKTPKP